MNENLILIVMGALTLLLISLLWLRQGIAYQLHSLRAQHHLLQVERDRVLNHLPLMLEGARGDVGFEPFWNPLRNDRTTLSRQPEITWDEWQLFEKKLRNSLGGLKTQNLIALEGKKDLEDDLARIQTLQNALVSQKESYDALQKKFPTSVAFAIFGFRKFQL